MRRTRSKSVPPETPAEESASKMRRTTRARKAAAPADVFGPPVAVSLRAPPRDRSSATGMSQVALVALTKKNTERNQRYCVALETEIVRRAGERPESPVMKVRSIAQREQEERELARGERAKRRARRGKSGEGEGDGEGDGSESGEVSMETEWDEGGNVDAEEVEGARMKHRRGAGDDEDYETPFKQDRPFKRGRFEEVEARDVQEKRVKWDRGLFTTVCLDDIVPQGRRPEKEELSKKGCLTPYAKVSRPFRVALNGSDALR